MRINHKKFFAEFKPYFKEVTGKNITPSQVKNLDFLLGKFQMSEWFSADVRRIAYAIATATVETYIPKSNSRYAPITEFGGEKYFHKYDSGKLARRLGNTPDLDGDGFLYRGRGFVQITGKRNYAHFGIANDPDKALDPDTAFQIMEDGMRTGFFTGRKLSEFINATGTDYKNARRVINGQDRAQEIAGYARNIEHFLREAISAASASSDGAQSDAGDELTAPVGNTADGSQSQLSDPPTSDSEATHETPKPKATLWDRITGRFDGWGDKADKLEGYAARLPMSFSSKLNVIGMKALGLLLGLWGVLVDHPIYAALGTALIIAAAWYLSHSKDRNAVASSPQNQNQAQTVVVEK